MKNFDIKLTTLFIVLFLVALLNAYFFIWLTNSYFHYKGSNIESFEFTHAQKFIIIVIAAPFIETYLFQYLPHALLQKLNVKNSILLILLPSLVFGAAHFYSWIYAVMAFFGGIYMNILYVYAKSRSGYSFLIVTGFHALYNLYGFLFVV